MDVCVDRFGSRGSWLHTIMSMWNRDARNRRSRCPDSPVQAVTGMIFAAFPHLAPTARYLFG